MNQNKQNEPIEYQPQHKIHRTFLTVLTVSCLTEKQVQIRDWFDWLSKTSLNFKKILFFQ